MGEEAKKMPLQLRKADGTTYDLAGKFDSVDNEFDAGTGTIRVITEFPNPDGALAAGLSIRLRVPEELESAVIIPAAAIQRDLLGTYVFVLGEGNKAARQNVEVSAFSVDGFARYSIIESGLTAESRVIVSNLQRVRPDAELAPTEIDPPTLQKAEDAAAPAEEEAEPGGASDPDQNNGGGQGA